MDRLTAKTIKDLLAQRHKDDVFVPECKTGATPCPIIDAWAFKKSWANPCAWGYEIKVSRGDFLRDEKWHSYLNYCNLFSFVCPFGLISPEELPDGVGLLYVTKTGTRLYTKRKAAKRDVDIPDEIYRHVLMSRTKVTRDRSDRAEYWRQWLVKKDENRRLGYNVTGKIAEIWRETQRENKCLKRENETLQEVRGRLDALGIKDAKGAFRIYRDLEELDRRMANKLSNGMMTTVLSLKRQIEQFEEMVKDAH